MSVLTLDDLEVPSIVTPNFMEQHLLKPLYPLIQTRLSDVGVVITDRHSKIRYINRAFTKITGYNFKEIKGKNPRILQSGYHDNSFYQTMWQSIIRTGQWIGEVLDRRKDGNIYLESLHIIALKNDKEEVTGYIGIITDITEYEATESQTRCIEDS
ncbi:PAS domain-containing protein [Ammoniphilus sp. YIM 78166]|uniref:PAS domain-containing protein n=1 Tax=Ammoniphilus sp. YIM 78166 TaxID=1644106 RepID=UPI00106F1712|nr:PAS domain-containing protein [Ammoniphilus sp. YIM 78166]